MLRCRRLALYSTLEMLVGVIGAMYIANTLWNGSLTSTYAAAFFSEIAALYVIVRGLDNYYKSLSGKAKERWDDIYFKEKYD